MNIIFIGEKQEMQTLRFLLQEAKQALLKMVFVKARILAEYIN